MDTKFDSKTDLKPPLKILRDHPSDNDFSPIGKIDDKILKIAAERSLEARAVNGCIGCDGNRCGTGCARKLIALAKNLLNPEKIQNAGRAIPEFSALYSLVKKGILNPVQLVKDLDNASKQLSLKELLDSATQKLNSAQMSAQQHQQEALKIQTQASKIAGLPILQEVQRSIESFKRASSDRGFDASRVELGKAELVKPDSSTRSELVSITSRKHESSSTIASVASNYSQVVLSENKNASTQKNLEPSIPRAVEVKPASTKAISGESPVTQDQKTTSTEAVKFAVEVKITKIPIKAADENPRQASSIKNSAINQNSTTSTNLRPPSIEQAEVPKAISIPNHKDLSPVAQTSTTPAASSVSSFIFQFKKIADFIPTARQEETKANTFSYTSTNPPPEANIGGHTLPQSATSSLDHEKSQVHHLQSPNEAKQKPIHTFQNFEDRNSAQGSRSSEQDRPIAQHIPFTNSTTNSPTARAFQAEFIFKNSVAKLDHLLQNFDYNKESIVAQLRAISTNLKQSLPNQSNSETYVNLCKNFEKVRQHNANDQDTRLARIVNALEIRIADRSVHRLEVLTQTNTPLVGNRSTTEINNRMIAISSVDINKLPPRLVEKLAAILHKLEIISGSTDTKQHTKNQIVFRLKAYLSPLDLVKIRAHALERNVKSSSAITTRLALEVKIERSKNALALNLKLQRQLANKGDLLSQLPLKLRERSLLVQIAQLKNKVLLLNHNLKNSDKTRNVNLRQTSKKEIRLISPLVKRIIAIKELLEKIKTQLPNRSSLSSQNKNLQLSALQRQVFKLLLKHIQKISGLNQTLIKDLVRLIKLSRLVNNSGIEKNQSNQLKLLIKSTANRLAIRQIDRVLKSLSLDPSLKSQPKLPLKDLNKILSIIRPAVLTPTSLVRLKMLLMRLESLHSGRKLDQNLKFAQTKLLAFKITEIINQRPDISSKFLKSSSIRLLDLSLKLKAITAKESSLILKLSLSQKELKSLQMQLKQKTSPQPESLLKSQVRSLITKISIIENNLVRLKSLQVKLNAKISTKQNLQDLKKELTNSNLKNSSALNKVERTTKQIRILHTKLNALTNAKDSNQLDSLKQKLTQLERLLKRHLLKLEKSEHLLNNLKSQRSKVSQTIITNLKQSDRSSSSQSQKQNENLLSRQIFSTKAFVKEMLVSHIQGKNILNSVEIRTSLIERLGKLINAMTQKEGLNISSAEKVNRLIQIQTLLIEEREISVRLLQEMIDLLEEDSEDGKSIIGKTSRKISPRRQSKKRHSNSSVTSQKGYGLQLETSKSQSPATKSNSSSATLQSQVRFVTNQKTGNRILSANKMPSKSLDISMAEEDDQRPNSYIKELAEAS